jgi:16S rRNA (cytosine967-C5)-methyltransferase
MASELAEKPERAAADAQVGLGSRRAAVELLHATLDKHQPLDQMLGQALSSGPMAELSSRDRALTRAIVATSLRRKGQIDLLLNRLLERGLPPKSGRLYAILLSAAAQLLFLQTPPHAAIGLAVTLTRYDGRAKRFDKLANAVLRRVAQDGPALIAAMDAARVNTPDWLWQRWSGVYGEARTRAMAELHLMEPPLDLSVAGDATAWAGRLEARVLPGGRSVRLLPKGRIEDLDGFAQGQWWVQDFAASLPVRLFGDVAGLRVLDLCAAPGGKTAQLAAAGASVLAVDISAARLKPLQENLARLGLSADIAVGDAATWTPQERFEAILLDAPCSSTGTIRRHPDIPYLKSETDVVALAALQARLIDHAATLLRPGGTLVYSTCSLEPEEGEAQIAALLVRNHRLRLDPIQEGEVFGRGDWLNAGGALRTLPSLLDMTPAGWSGMDGFFAARLKAAA